MKNTEKTTFDSSTDWENVSTLYRVFSGNVTFNSTGWTTITFSTPFDYDGVSNLLLCVDDHTGKGLDSYNRFYTYSTGENRAITTFRDGSAAYNPATANIYAGTRYTVNDQIKFTKAVTGCNESLALSTEQLFGFRYEEGQGPSETQSLSIVGANLAGNVALEASSSFEISIDGNSFGTTLTLTPSNGQVAQLVTVRLQAGLEVGRYEGEALTLTSGSISRSIALSGEVTGEEVPVPIVTQTFSMKQGWNWWSTYLDISLEDLEEALDGHGTDINAQNGSTSYLEGYGWEGDPITIDPIRMYKIHTDEAIELVLNGIAIDPADHTVTLKPGRTTWIGFPESESMTLSQAFANHTPTKGDIVKGANGSATWIGNIWTGTLKKLEPGEGYAYKSKAATQKTFTFPSGK